MHICTLLNAIDKTKREKKAKEKNRKKNYSWAYNLMPIKLIYKEDTNELHPPHEINDEWAENNGIDSHARLSSFFLRIIFSRGVKFSASHFGTFFEQLFFNVFQLSKKNENDDDIIYINS